MLWLFQIETGRFPVKYQIVQTSSPQHPLQSDPLQRLPCPVAAFQACVCGQPCMASHVSAKPRLTCWHNLGWIRVVFSLQNLWLWCAFTALLPDFTILYHCTKTSLTRIWTVTHPSSERGNSKMQPSEFQPPIMSVHCGPVSPLAQNQMETRTQLKHNPDMSEMVSARA